ncbi:hypothetical protein AB4Z27_04355 [Cupriavidus sp. KB_39]|uniref:hypothetical protein n=1 Tax=Cupriavidus sp. KB_39 TaxID=3233036 RepID=UPI003F9349BE
MNENTGTSTMTFSTPASAGGQAMPVSRDAQRQQWQQSLDHTQGGTYDPRSGTANFVSDGRQMHSVEADPTGWLRAHGIVAVSDRTGQPVQPSVTQARQLVQAHLNNLAMNAGYAGAATGISANDNSLPPQFARVRGRFV